MKAQCGRSVAAFGQAVAMGLIRECWLCRVVGGWRICREFVGRWGGWPFGRGVVGVGKCRSRLGRACGGGELVVRAMNVSQVYRENTWIELH